MDDARPDDLTKPAPRASVPPRRAVLIASGATAAGAVLAGCQGMGPGGTVGAATPPAGPDAWFEQVRTEHRAAMGLFEKMLSTGDPAERAKLREALAQALTMHAVEEENAIYPALAMAGVATEAQHLYGEHAQLKVLLGELDVLPKDHPAWPSRVRNLQSIVAKHAQEEETRLYPAFMKAMSAEQNAALSTRYMREQARFRRS